LHSRFIRRIKPIDAFLNQTLDRAGHRNGLAFIGMAKKLIEEKRVAGRALDATLGESRIRGDQRLGKSASIAQRQRTEIDCRQQGAWRVRAPCLIQRIAFDPRGHNQEDGMLRDCGRQFGQVGQRQLIRPMEVLDD
jgi:hypothetical protein